MSNSFLANHTTLQLLEDASDELGRLDATCSLAPGAVAIAFQLVSIAGLFQPKHSSLGALVAAEADSLHDALLAPELLVWRALLGVEEKRVRGGARLNLARFGSVTPEFTVSAEVRGEPTEGLSATDDPRERLESIWREPSSSRSVIERAIDSAAWSPNAAVAEASAALLLCAGGRTARVRILPFAAVPAAERDVAIQRYRSGETATWTELSLRALAARARAARLSALTVIDASESEEARLRPLGRAAITARAALALLRQRLATTIPALAEDLGTSRPAANDALERLVTLGLAREVTGRARDRVFAYDVACTMGESLLATEAP